MDILKGIKNKIFFHMLQPIQSYFKDRLEEGQVDVSTQSVFDLNFSPTELNKNLTHSSPVLVESLWVEQIQIKSVDPFELIVSSPLLCLKLNPDFVPSKEQASMSIEELAKSTMQVSEELLKESVVNYLDSSKSTGGEMFRRVINVLIHRVSVTIDKIVIALEIPNKVDNSKIDILRINIGKIKISDSSQISKSSALSISYSSMFSLAERKRVDISDVSIELFQTANVPRPETFHLPPINQEQDKIKTPTLLYIPNLTRIDLEIRPDPFDANISVSVNDIFLGIHHSQIPIISSMNEYISEIFSKKVELKKSQGTNKSQELKKSDKSIKNDQNKSSSSVNNQPSSSNKDNTKIQVVKQTVANHTNSHNHSNNHSSKPIMFAAIPDEEDEDDAEYYSDYDDSEEYDHIQVSLNDKDDDSEAKEPSPRGQQNDDLEASQLAEEGPSYQISIKCEISSVQLSVIPSNIHGYQEKVDLDKIFTRANIQKPKLTNSHLISLSLRNALIYSRTTQDNPQSKYISSHQFSVKKLSLREKYKFDQIEAENIPHGRIHGKFEGEYCSYPILKIGHPRGYRSPAQDSSNKARPNLHNQLGNTTIFDFPTFDDFFDDKNSSLLIKFGNEKEKDSLSVEWDSMSVSLPAGIPQLINQAIKDFQSKFVFSHPNPEQNVVQNQEKNVNNQKPEMIDPIVSPPLSPPESKDPIPPLLKSPLHMKNRALIDSSSSSESTDLQNSRFSETEEQSSHVKESHHLNDEARHGVIDYAEEDDSLVDDHQTSNPFLTTIKGKNVIIMLRINSSDASRFSFPLFRNEFLVVHIVDPKYSKIDNGEQILTNSVPLYHLNNPKIKYDTTVHPKLSTASFEFTKASIYLDEGKTVENFDYSLLAQPDRIYRHAIPKCFMEITASSSSVTETNPEAVIIQSRRFDLILNQKIQQSTNSNKPSNTFPNFVFQEETFERAPFSSTWSRYEDKEKAPECMDEHTLEIFRTKLLETSQTSLIITLHYIHLELTKSQADKIQELLDSMSDRQKDQEQSEDSKIEQESNSNENPFIGIVTPFSIDMRVKFATISLKTQENEYNFDNVQDIRVLQVGNYLQTGKSFLIAQIGSAKLPHSQNISMGSNIINKIPDWNARYPTFMLNVILSTEMVSEPNMLSKPRKDSKSDHDHHSDQNIEPLQPHLKKRPKTTILVESNRLGIEFIFGDVWISELSGFFVRDLPYDPQAPKVETLLFVNAKNSSLSLTGYPKMMAKRRKQVNANLLFHFDKFVVSSTFQLPIDPASNSELIFDIRSYMAQIFLVDDKGCLRDKPREGESIWNFRRYWLGRGYEPSGFIETLFARITLNSIHYPKMSINLNMNANLDSTADQIQTLMDLLASFSKEEHQDSISTSKDIGSSASSYNSNISGDTTSSSNLQNEESQEEYVVVQMSQNQAKQRLALLEQQKLLSAFKMAKKPPNEPIVRWIPHNDASLGTSSSNAHQRMPELIHNYLPSKPKHSKQLPRLDFVFSLESDSFVWRFREGFAWVDDSSEGHPKVYKDNLSRTIGKHVDLVLQNLRVHFSSDELQQTELAVQIKNMLMTSGVGTNDVTEEQEETLAEFSGMGSTSSLNPSSQYAQYSTFSNRHNQVGGERVFISFDHRGNSYGPNILSLRLRSLKNVQEDSPAFSISRGNAISNDGESADLESIPCAVNSKSPLTSTLHFRLLPLCISVDSEVINFVLEFIRTIRQSKPEEVDPSNKVDNDISTTASNEPFFHRVSISAISLRLSVSNYYTFTVDNAVLKLPSLYCRQVPGWSGVSSEVLSAYYPHLYSSVFTVAAAVPVVSLILSLISSVSNLVIQPYTEYNQGRSAIGGAYSAVVTGASSMANEFLKFGIWLTSSASDGFSFLESFWKTSNTSNTQNDPNNVQEGAQQGYANMARQINDVRDCLVVMPWREYQQRGSVTGLVSGVAGAVPLAVIKPVIGATSGLSKVMKGASNSLAAPSSSPNRPSNLASEMNKPGSLKIPKKN